MSTLGVSALGHYEHEGLRDNNLCRDQFITVAELHTGHARSRTSHRTQRLIVSVEAQRHTIARDQQNIIFGRDEERRDHFVIITQVNRD